MVPGSGTALWQTSAGTALLAGVRLLWTHASWVPGQIRPKVSGRRREALSVEQELQFDTFETLIDFDLPGRSAFERERTLQHALAISSLQADLQIRLDEAFFSSRSVRVHHYRVQPATESLHLPGQQARIAECP